MSSTQTRNAAQKGLAIDEVVLQGKEAKQHLGADRLWHWLRFPLRAWRRGFQKSGLDRREVVREARLVLPQSRSLARPATAMDVDADQLFQQSGPAILQVAVQVILDQGPAPMRDASSNRSATSSIQFSPT